MADLLRSAVKSVVIETEWLPTIVMDDPFAPSDPNATSAAKLLKPRISIYSNYTAQPMVMQPYGAPQSNWPILKLGLMLVGGALAVGAVVRLLRRRPRPSAGVAGLGALAPWLVVEDNETGERYVMPRDDFTNGRRRHFTAIVDLPTRAEAAKYRREHPFSSRRPVFDGLRRRRRSRRRARK